MTETKKKSKKVKVKGKKTKGADDADKEEQAGDSSNPLDRKDFMKDWGFADNSCHCCGKRNSDIGGYLMQCGKCKKATYCSLKCFNKHIAEHQKFCQTNLLTSEPMRRHGSIASLRPDDDDLDAMAKRDKSKLKRNKSMPLDDKKKKERIAARRQAGRAALVLRDDSSSSSEEETKKPAKVKRTKSMPLDALRKSTKKKASIKKKGSLKKKASKPPVSPPPPVDSSSEEDESSESSSSEDEKAPIKRKVSKPPVSAPPPVNSSSEEGESSESSSSEDEKAPVTKKVSKPPAPAPPPVDSSSEEKGLVKKKASEPPVPDPPPVESSSQEDESSESSSSEEEKASVNMKASEPPVPPPPDDCSSEEDESSVNDKASEVANREEKQVETPPPESANTEPMPRDSSSSEEGSESTANKAGPISIGEESEKDDVGRESCEQMTRLESTTDQSQDSTMMLTNKTRDDSCTTSPLTNTVRLRHTDQTKIEYVWEKPVWAKGVNLRKTRSGSLIGLQASLQDSQNDGINERVGTETRVNNGDFVDSGEKQDRRLDDELGAETCSTREADDDAPDDADELIGGRRKIPSRKSINERPALQGNQNSLSFKKQSLGESASSMNDSVQLHHADQSMKRYEWQKPDWAKGKNLQKTKSGSLIALQASLVLEATRDPGTKNQNLHGDESEMDDDDDVWLQETYGSDRIAGADDDARIPPAKSRSRNLDSRIGDEQEPTSCVAAADRNDDDESSNNNNADLLTPYRHGLTSKKYEWEKPEWALKGGTGLLRKTSIRGGGSGGPSSRGVSRSKTS